ncbi:MAG: hypothetical protein ACI8S6_005255 [Myxococcota bacterium]|jgi:hypothetical protein
MLITILTCLSTAQALEGLTGQWLPGASPLRPRQGWVAGGGAWDWGGPGGDGEGLLMRGVVGLGYRTALSAEGHLSLGDPVADLGLGVRTIVLSTDGFRLAPFGHFVFNGDGLDGYLGLAGHMTADRVDIDASFTLVQLDLSEGSSEGSIILPPDAMNAFDLGVSIAPAGGQELRIGALYQDRFRLTLGYRWLGDWWLVQADLLWWPRDTGARVLAGLRF